MNSRSPFALFEIWKNQNVAGKDSAAIPHLPLMFLHPFKYNSAAAVAPAETVLAFAQ